MFGQFRRLFRRSSKSGQSHLDRCLLHFMHHIINPKVSTIQDWASSGALSSERTPGLCKSPPTNNCTLCCRNKRHRERRNIYEPCRSMDTYVVFRRSFCCILVKIAFEKCLYTMFFNNKVHQSWKRRLHFHVTKNRVQLPDIVRIDSNRLSVISHYQSLVSHCNNLCQIVLAIIFQCAKTLSE